jgi:hypothetical protein
MKCLPVLVIACLGMLVICCSGIATRGHPQYPNSQPTDEGIETRPSAPDESADSATEDVRVSFDCPEGWQRDFDAEQDMMVLRHPSGPTIKFSIWPLDQESAFQVIYRFWEFFELEAERGEPIEPGQPITGTFDGVETTYMISVLTREDGVRVSLVLSAFTSNDDRYGIIISGTWPEDENDSMMSVFRQVAQSIRVQTD